MTNASVDVLKQELANSKKKNNELQEQLKSCALQVLEQERRLIQSLDADDVDEDLDDLKARIENYNPVEATAEESRRNSLMSRMSLRNLGNSSGSTRKMSLRGMSSSTFQPTVPAPPVKKNVPPEKAIFLAFTSLGNSIEYFEEERELFMSKMDILKEEKEKQQIMYDKKIQELESKLEILETETETLNEVAEKQEVEVAELQDVGDKVEELEGERDRLEEQCQNLEDEIFLLRSRNELEDARREEADEATSLKVQEMQDRIDQLEDKVEQLEAERDTLFNQNKAQQSTLSKTRRLKHFDERLEEKASDFKQEETKARLLDLEAELQKTKAQCKFQQRRIEEIDQLNQDMQALVKEVQEMEEQTVIKSDSLEHALIILNQEKSGLQARVQDLEDEREMLLFKCNAQQDAIITVKRESEKNHRFTRESSLRFEKVEDDRERLSIKCKVLEAQIENLQRDLKSKTMECESAAQIESLQSKIKDLEEKLGIECSDSKDPPESLTGL